MRKLVTSAPVIFCAIAIWLGFALASAQAQCASPLNDINYTKYTLVEGAIYSETNPGPPVLAATNDYFFIAMVNLKTNYTAAFANLIIPGGTPQAMQGGPRVFSFGAQATNFAALNAAYPDGAYQFNVSNDFATVNFPDSAVLPNPPTLSDFAGAQTIDPSKDFTLRWNSYTNGTTKDIIEAEVIGDGIDFQTPAYRCPSSLDGKATSVVIPANTLSSNATYRVRLTFVKVLTLDTNSTPFVALLAGTEVETTAIITTVSASSGPAAPQLENILAPTGGGVRFDVTTTPGSNYLIQVNLSLTNGSGWSTLLSTNALGSTVSFTNNPTAGKTHFYRVVEP